MQYKSQAVAMPYFIAAIGLFVGQIIFGLILGAIIAQAVTLVAKLKPAKSAH